ncbi:SET domain-containing protein [Thiorhodovibrio frisius]|uniref:SET domain-containing protein n=1 Tax=Thiorhodovibrio frisius TaxID=631362 RepID=H8Z5A6_9GAMM|nr:hypothetical protein [Thiorhodovibrio frisius]EIC20513.1 hypothetical protein Thi970DRAFT_04154 [Thiorhodovibrio frisius]WPL21257.1 hypothetical protein Thiofri_01369 [Thiorhodovibrio frisius]
MIDFRHRFAVWKTIATNHGCVFKNVDFIADDNGVRVVAERPSERIFLHVPAKLLVNLDDVKLTDDAHQVIPSSCSNGVWRALIDDMLGFILSPGRLTKRRQLLREFNRLPPTLKYTLANSGLTPALCAQENPNSLVSKSLAALQEDRSGSHSEILAPKDKELKYHLLKERVLKDKNQTFVLMPFIDFINHDSEGLTFQVGDAGLTVSGLCSPSREVFAKYNHSDPWGLLDGYLFTGPSHYAFSVSAQLRLPDGCRLVIARRAEDYEPHENGLRIPKTEREGQTVHFSNLWLGAVERPESPFESFKIAWESLGRGNAFSVFSQIVRHNWAIMREIRHLCQGVDTAAGQLVRLALDEHLRVLSQQHIS